MNIPQQTACLPKGYVNNKLFLINRIYIPKVRNSQMSYTKGQFRTLNFSVRCRTEQASIDRQCGRISLAGSQNLCQTINDILSIKAESHPN